MGTTAVAVRTPSLLGRLAAARVRSDELFAVVRPEAFCDRLIPEQQRIIFYAGHLEADDWNLLGGRHFDLPAFDPTFDQLFAFGIDPVDGRLPADTPQDWPTRAQVCAHNERLAASFDPYTERPLEYTRLPHLAIKPHLMHAETLAYMLHQLPRDRKFPRRDSLAPPAWPVTPRMVRTPSGAATLSLRRTEDSPFGWDNEFEEHRVTVPEFRIAAHRVTNRDFLNFLSIGGYQEPSLWEDVRWHSLQSGGISHPAFWVFLSSGHFLRTMFGEISLPPDWCGGEPTDS